MFYLMNHSRIYPHQANYQSNRWIKKYYLDCIHFKIKAAPPFASVLLKRCRLNVIPAVTNVMFPSLKDSQHWWLHVWLDSVKTLTWSVMTGSAASLASSHRAQNEKSTAAMGVEPLELFTIIFSLEYKV